MLLISPPGKSFSTAIMGGSFKEVKSVQSGVTLRLAPSASNFSNGMCFSAPASLDALCAKRNRVPLPYARKLLYQPARVRPTWDAHRAIRRRGTHTEVIVNIVDVVVAVLVHAKGIIIVIRGTEPPQPGAQSSFNPIPL